jgi:hypothetical protein
LLFRGGKWYNRFPEGGTLQGSTTHEVRVCVVRLVSFVLVLTCTGHARPAPPLTAPDGDLNQDGAVDALDLQCLVLVFAQVEAAPAGKADVCAADVECQEQAGAGYLCRPAFSGQLVCLPPCLHPEVVLSGESVDCPAPTADTADCKGLVPRRITDLNCDGQVTNQDFQFLVAVAVGKVGGPGTADVDGDGILNSCDPDTDGDGVPDLVDGCPLDADPLLVDSDGDLLGDVCDPDDDGDGDPDATDCQPLSPLAAAGLPEVCDGLDNNCDGRVDEDCPESVTGGLVSAGLTYVQSGGQSVQLTFGQGAVGLSVGEGVSAAVGLGACATAGSE